MNIEEIKSLEIDAVEARAREIETMDKTEKTTEELEALANEAEALEERAKSLENAARFEQEKREAVALGNAGETIAEDLQPKQEERKMKTIEEIRKSQEYVDAYARYIKTNDEAECRALLSENAPEGGNLPVPTVVYNIIKTAWDKEGIMSRVKKAYIKGNLRISFERSATGAVIHEEGTPAPTEQQLVLGIVEMVPKSIKKWITISDEALDLSGEAFLDYIYNEIAYHIAKKTADEVVGAIEASPATATATAPAVPTIQAATIAAGTIASALGQLSDEANNPVVIMNKATWAAFKAVQYANGYAVDVFENCDVVFDNTVKSFDAATTGETYAIVGDLEQGALVNLPNGESIKFTLDEKSLAEADLVKIVGRLYAGVGVVASNAFVKIQK